MRLLRWKMKINKKTRKWLTAILASTSGGLFSYATVSVLGALLLGVYIVEMSTNVLLFAFSFAAFSVLVDLEAEVEDDAK